MNRNIIKLAASVLSVPLGLSLFTACSHGNPASSVAGQTSVTGNTPWYDVETSVIADDADLSDYSYRYRQFAGVWDDKLVFRTSSSYLPDGQDEARGLEELSSYDLDGNLIAHSELTEQISSFDLGASVMIYDTEKTADGISVIYYVYDEDYNTIGSFASLWDVNTGDLSEAVSLENSRYSEELGTSLPLRTFPVGDKTIEFYYVWNEQCDSILLVKDSDGSETLIDLAEKLPAVDVDRVSDIPVITQTGEGKALVCLGMYNNIIYLDLDLNTLEVSVSQDDYSWLDDSVPDIRFVDGLGCIVINGDGISSIDFDGQQLIDILSYSNCNVNRYVMDDFYPVMATEDRVVMTGVIHEPYVPGTSASDEIGIMVFTKADSNPNEGKTIIRIASIPGYSYALCDAVCRFNDQSEEYFAQFDTRYELTEYTDSLSAGYGFDTLGALCRDVNADLGNQLSVDLLAGEGPDIIIGGAAYSQLNNPDYLIDLTDYINTNFAESDYFMNVIDASATAGAVYQLPVSFCVAGIAAHSEDIAPGQRGFTFDEYEAFVSGPCNGADPLQYGKNDYFITLMNEMKDLMIGLDGYFEFDNDAFRALAGFVDQHVNNPLELEDEGYYFPEDDTACEMVINGLNIYHRRVLNNNKVLVGYPSYDGRGPIIVGNSSIAVSALTSSTDGCLEFVSTVMGPECQKYFGCEYAIPVNRAAFEALCDDYVNGFNRDLALQLRSNTAEDLRMMGRPWQEIDSSLIENYESLIENLDGCLYEVDAPVDAIIIEEIPGFFEGQKTLDEVIRVVDNRARYVIDERK